MKQLFIKVGFSKLIIFSQLRDTITVISMILEISKTIDHWKLSNNVFLQSSTRQMIRIH